MSKRWSAGVFLAKARELSRRLRSWHVEPFLDPVQFVYNQRDARRWTYRTFRDTIAGASASATPRHEDWQYYPHPGGKPDEKGCVGEAYQSPDRDADRTMARWLMGEFLRHLEAAPPLPALDYLKEAFGQILNLPAWGVVEPPPELRSGEDASALMVTGRMVPADRLDTLVDAAEKLLPAAPSDWASPAGPSPPPLAADAPAWLRRLRSLRAEFERFANGEPRLRHLVIQPLSLERLPEELATGMKAGGNHFHKCEIWAWVGGRPEYRFGEAVRRVSCLGRAHVRPRRAHGGSPSDE